MRQEVVQEMQLFEKKERICCIDVGIGRWVKGVYLPRVQSGKKRIGMWLVAAGGASSRSRLISFSKRLRNMVAIQNNLRRNSVVVTIAMTASVRPTCRFQEVMLSMSRNQMMLIRTQSDARRHEDAEMKDSKEIEGETPVIEGETPVMLAEKSCISLRYFRVLVSFHSLPHFPSLLD